MPYPPERRAAPRYPLRATLNFSHAAQAYSGNCLDLGKGGLSFEANLDLPLAEKLALKVTLLVGTAQAKLALPGVIRWKQESDAGAFRYGVTFAELTPAQWKVLAEFLGGTGAPPLTGVD